MITQTIYVNEYSPQTIVIGRRGTYDTMQIAFNLAYLIENYGNGTAVLAVKRSQDESAYPAIVTQEDATLLWTVNETDTAYVGSGECQLMWYVDGGLAKTIIYPMVVMRDILTTAEEPPDGYENWVEHLTKLGAKTQQNAQEAAQSATEAKASEENAAESAQRAEDAAGMLVDVSATATTLEPDEPATAEYDEGVFKFGIPKGDKLTYEDLTEADKEDLVQGPIKAAQDVAVEAVGTAKTNAVDAVNQAGTNQVDAVNGAGATQVQNVNSAGSTQVNTVNQAGSTQIGNVKTEGATQVQAVENKGAEVIGSIPPDYSDLAAEVSDLNRQINDETTGLDTKAPAILETASGAIASFDDGADGMPIKKLVAQIEPVQDLHGYENPWPVGGGKNKIPVTVEIIKRTNQGAAWNNNTTTINGITWTILTDSDGNVIGLQANGTASANSLINITAVYSYDVNESAIFTGTPSGGSGKTYLTALYNEDTTKQEINQTTIPMTISSDYYGKNVRFFCAVISGVTVSNLVFYPMIRLATESDATFAPYSNICPFTGWTGLSGVRTGKNLLPLTLDNLKALNKAGAWDGNSYTQFGITFTANTDEDNKVTSITLNGTATGNVGLMFVYQTMQWIRPLMLGKSFTLTGGSSVAKLVAFNMLGNGSSAMETGSGYTFTFSNKNANFNISVYASTGETFNNVVVKPLLRLASDSDSTFEPYVSDTISVNWQSQAGTVYGGTLDVISGKMVVDRAIKTLDGSGSWIAVSGWPTSPHAFQLTINNLHGTDAGADNCICDVYRSDVSPWNNDFACRNMFNGYLVISDSRFSTLEDYKSYLAGNNVQVIYPLITPIEYQLTPQEVTTLLGNNVVYTDVGPVSVEYPADTKMYIDNKITQAIAAALNA